MFFLFKTNPKIPIKKIISDKLIMKLYILINYIGVQNDNFFILFYTKIQKKITNHLCITFLDLKT